MPFPFIALHISPPPPPPPPVSRALVSTSLCRRIRMAADWSTRRCAVDGQHGRMGRAGWRVGGGGGGGIFVLLYVDCHMPLQTQTLCPI